VSFTVTALPAAQGDALWIEYGTRSAPSRVIVDGGTLETETVVQDRIRAVGSSSVVIDLLVVTHVDSDHIAGILKLLAAQNPGVTFRDVWFNAWRHLDPTHIPSGDILGPAEGEYLSVRLTDRHDPWNVAFGGKAVVVPDAGNLPVRTLDRGMKLTLLSPTQAQLSALIPKWKQDVQKAHLVPGDLAVARDRLAGLKRYVPKDVLGGTIDVETLAAQPFHSDTTKPNASSIGFLAEYEGRSCLFTGDGQMPVLVPTLRRLCNERGTDRLAVDALKMPHHGSRANISVEFLKLLDCGNYIVSSSGAIYNHPDTEAIARVITHGGVRPTLHFNYRTEYNTMWDAEAVKARHKYKTVFAEDGEPLVMDL